MTRVWYTSDTHFSHKLVAQRRGFTKTEVIDGEEKETGDTEAHDAAIIRNWNTVVKPDDIVWHMGDVGMGHLDRFLPQVEQLNGKIHLITGNHDDPFPGHRDSFRHQRYWLQYFESVQAYARKKLWGIQVLLSHFPYDSDHTAEIRYTQYRLRDEGLWLLHGHTHSSAQLTGRQLHVGLDAWGLHPVAESVVIQILEEVSRDGVGQVSLLPERAQAHTHGEACQAPHVGCESREDDQVHGDMAATREVRLTNPPTSSNVGSMMRLGGFSEAARVLAAETGRSHTRQGVHRMWQRREVNGFPERHEYEINGKIKEFFDLAEVLAWQARRGVDEPPDRS